MRNNHHPFTGVFDNLRPVSQRIGKVCAIFAAGIYERLDRIAENTGDGMTRRRFTDPLVFAGAGTKDREVPVGQTWRLALLAVSAATTITIRSGGTLQYTKVFATADTIGPDAMISAGAGTPVSVQSSAAAEVTLHIEACQRDEAQPGVSGDYSPLGIRTNAMALAIEQHFPGVLDTDGDPYNLRHLAAPGSIYGAGSPTKNPVEGEAE